MWLFCLFCTVQDVCSEADATDLTERCELIGDRLIALEDKLQTALLNRDQALTHILPLQPKCIKILRFFTSVPLDPLKAF